MARKSSRRAGVARTHRQAQGLILDCSTVQTGKFPGGKNCFITRVGKLKKCTGGIMKKKGLCANYVRILQMPPAGLPRYRGRK